MASNLPLAVRVLRDIEAMLERMTTANLAHARGQALGAVRTVIAHIASPTPPASEATDSETLLCDGCTPRRWITRADCERCVNKPPASEPESARAVAARLGIHVEPSQERIDAVSPPRCEPEAERVCRGCDGYLVLGPWCSIRDDETDPDDCCKHWTPRKGEEASDGE